jgi:hypothetical protein
MKYRVPVRFVIHGSVDVSAPNDATMDELFDLADHKSGDVVERMMAHSTSTGGTAETFPTRSMRNVRIVRMRR